jgi:hypothetical protein
MFFAYSVQFINILKNVLAHDCLSCLTACGLIKEEEGKIGNLFTVYRLTSHPDILASAWPAPLSSFYTLLLSTQTAFIFSTPYIIHLKIYVSLKP